MVPMPHKIAVIGLGYVGLPLAVEFAKQYDVVGFDIDEARVRELKAGLDHTQEVDIEVLNAVVGRRQESERTGLLFSSDPASLLDRTVYIVTVPTPLDRFKAPDLRPLLRASAMLGGVLKRGDLVIYESTVDPGCTEEDCVLVLERESGLRFN